MGAGEESSHAKLSKPTASTQQREVPATPSFPDWSASMQAYYGGAGATPPPFFASPVASPGPHPYLWGSQHPMVAPYGAPLPYPALYPQGGLYAHPNMAAGVALTVTGAEVREPNGKDAGFMNKSKGASGKETSGSGREGASRSDESDSEGSSEASEENANQQASSVTKKRSSNQMIANGGKSKIDDAAQFDSDNRSAPAPGKPAMPATSLNIGMDLWNASPVGAKPMTMRPNASALQVDSATMAVREGLSHDHHWNQDNRELKREKRKQSNRESARRSRMRKQAECEELQVKVDKLSDENRTLRDEVHRLAEECEKITSENNTIMEELTNLYGPAAISNFQDRYHKTAFKSINGEDNSNGLETSTENNPNSISGQNGHFFNSNGTRDS